MTRNKAQTERLDYLLKKFKEDSVYYGDLEVGDDYEEKRMALRALMNIRGQSLTGSFLMYLKIWTGSCMKKSWPDNTYFLK